MAELYPRSYAQYVLLERLGTGGMSEVDLARKVVDAESFVRFLVVKRIKAGRTEDPSFVRMLKDEARITGALHHENIGALYDFGKVGDEYYLALEYVPGVDLRYLINTLRERGQRVPVRIALKIVAEVLDGLEHAHTKTDANGRPMAIVHRDVNPRNVMVSVRGEVKLIDFGVAKATDRLEQTRTDHVKGKYVYMAPEQLTGNATDHRSDLYAAGLMLHELLTGVNPFFGLNSVQVLHRMMSATPPALPALNEVADDRELRRVHDRALEHDPNQRYSSAARMAADLRAVAAPLGGLPNNEKLAAFLATVDPDLGPRLRRKMAAYAHTAIPREPTDDVALPEPIGPEPPAPGPLEPDSLSVSRTGLLAGSFVVVSFGSVVVGGLIVGVVVLLLWLVTASPPAPAPAVVPPLAMPLPRPDPIEPLPVPVAPVSVVVPTALPGPRPIEPAPAPVVRPALVPEPVPEPVVPEPAPVPAPQPVPVPTPQPVVPAAPTEVVHPTPSVQEFGFVNVGATDRGQNVMLNGEVVGVTPLTRFRVPVGIYTVQVLGYSCAPRVVMIPRNQVESVTCK